jgi:GAF domain-containing protein
MEKDSSMIAPPLPINESNRLEALRQLLLMDTPKEERFERIAEFARFEFDISTVLISMVDDERVWFKSAIGTNLCQVNRDISFCAHAILQPNIMVVEDALKDERFFDNPLVIGEPFVRFYAGAQLTLSSGQTIGALCLMHNQPREMDETGLMIMSTLRDMVVLELTSMVEREI